MVSERQHHSMKSSKLDTALGPDNNALESILIMQHMTNA
jgi:hypothetical protein